jgi:hypothetical protein
VISQPKLKQGLDAVAAALADLGRSPARRWPRPRVDQARALNGTGPRTHPGFGTLVRSLSSITLAVSSFALTDDLVNKLFEWDGSVDHDAVARDLSFRLVQSHNDFPFRWFAAPLVHSAIKPAVQRVQVDLEDEDTVEQGHELREVPRAAAEECHSLILAGDQGFHSTHRPDVMLV